MSGRRRLTAQGLERKQQLLDCAAALFAERGFADTRVIDIVAAAGVAKGLFYWYFENKDAVFVELITSTRQKLRLAQRGAIDRSLDPLSQLRQGTEASVRFMAGHAHLYALLQVDGPDQRIDELLREGTQVHATDTATLIQRGIGAGLVRDEDPMLLAYGVIGSVTWFCRFHRTGRIELSPDELATFVGRYVVRSVAAEGVEEAAAAGTAAALGC
jgi:AcrR family transcriptional regulator